MFSIRIIGRNPLGHLRLVISPPPPQPGTWSRPLRSHHHPAINLNRSIIQRRCYAQQVPKSSAKTPPSSTGKLQQQQQQQAKAAASGSKDHEIPERLLIYHAGTGRITFLAMVKVTTLFLGAFFTCIVVPGYVKAEKPELETVGVALCGIIPLLFVAYTTSPFVTHIHIHLPPAARASRSVLDRFVHGALPPSTELTVTTMSAIAKPRYSVMQAGHLRPARRRFGIVNYLRDGEGAAAENETRRWYNLRALTKFCVQEVRSEKNGKGSGKGKGGGAAVKRVKDLTEPWIWDVLKERIGSRGAAKSA